MLIALARNVVPELSIAISWHIPPAGDAVSANLQTFAAPPKLSIGGDGAMRAFGQGIFRMSRLAAPDTAPS